MISFFLCVESAEVTGDTVVEREGLALQVGTMERGWLEWRRGDASEQSGEIATRQPLQLHIIFNQGVTESTDEFVTLAADYFEIMAMLLSMGE